MVSRSALNSAQTSALTSSMISSMLLVAWILLVTAWSCFWNARRAPTSVCVDAWWLRTALIAFLPARTCGTAYSGLYILAAATLIFNEILTFCARRFPLLLRERGDAVPIHGRRTAALVSHDVRKRTVEGDLRVGALQIDQIYIRLVPLRGAVGAQRLGPEPHLLLPLGSEHRHRAELLG